MGPITYSLCQKQGIGLVMWLTFMCSFPPLIENEPFSLKDINQPISIAFESPVEKSYELSIDFAFPTTDDRVQDKFIGSRYCQNNTIPKNISESQKINFGKPINLKISVQNKENDLTVFDKIIKSFCTTSHRRNIKTRTITYIPLSEGDYIINIELLDKIVGLNDVNASIRLHAGRWLK